MRTLLIVLTACSYSPPQASNPGGDAPIQSDAPSDATVADGSPPIDATPPIDAPFDPATDCPGTYNISINGLTSRYRAILTTASWPTQHTACANDLPGKTHLIAYETANELNLVGTQATPRFLVGHFQLPDQQAVGANWFTVLGDAVDPAFWLAGQPNDDAGVENGDQDRAFINYNTGAGVQDGPASFEAEALCECDGKPIPPQIDAML